MSERDWSEDPFQLTAPPGAGPGDPAVVIGAGPFPAELVAFYGTIHAGIISRTSATDYIYRILIGSGASPVEAVGIVKTSVVREYSTFAPDPTPLLTMTDPSETHFSVNADLVVDGLFAVTSEIRGDPFGTGSVTILDNLLLPGGQVNAPAHAAETTSNGVDDAGFTQTTYSTNQSCSEVFVAPLSGRVRIDWHVRMESNTAGVRVLASINIRTGGTPGSGTLIFTAGDGDAIESGLQDRIQAAMFVYQGGLTPGSTYNAQIVYKVSAAGNGDMFDQTIAVLKML